MTTNNFDIKGLSDDEVLLSRKNHGENAVVFKDENHFLKAILKFFKDPMVLLLLVASTVYFFSGKTSDALFLASAIVLISAISSYQNARSRNALAKLKDFTFEKNLKGFAIKEPVFSFNKFPGVNKELGPEMKSTGEAIRFIKDLRDPYFRQLYKERSMHLSK